MASEKLLGYSFPPFNEVGEGGLLCILLSESDAAEILQEDRSSYFPEIVVSLDNYLFVFIPFFEFPS